MRCATQGAAGGSGNGSLHVRCRAASGSWHSLDTEKRQNSEVPHEHALTTRENCVIPRRRVFSSGARDRQQDVLRREILRSA